MQYYLGQYYTFHLEGDPSPTPNFARAVRWYKRAAEYENGNAMYMLGLLTYAGSGTEKNEEEARKLWENSKPEDPRAEEALRDCFETNLK